MKLASLFRSKVVQPALAALAFEPDVLAVAGDERAARMLADRTPGTGVRPAELAQPDGTLLTVWQVVR